VQDHLPFFVATVQTMRARKVVELGSRSGTSTVAWLYGLQETGGTLWTVDVAAAPPIGVHDRWVHVQGNDLAVDVIDQIPDDVDVLFIDTSHDYLHTVEELYAYVPKVRDGGVVLCHDTALDRPDGIGDQEPFPVRRAISVYCETFGYSWHERTGSYGLGVFVAGQSS
jgi:predicted O-methyltransferase YrrM